MGIASPFELLQALDRRCRKNSTGLPVNKVVVENWIGIGFSINNISLIAKMDEVNEILPPPQTIRVPGVKHWVKGLANIRGSLMPVLDMNSFLFGESTVSRKENRILIINKKGLVAGLLVDEVYGLRRFKPEEHQDQPSTEAGPLREFLSGIFVDQVRQWNVFNVEKLVTNQQFFRVV